MFGKGNKADEFFMAWNYACFLNKCAKAGKNEYPLPMFVNAWIVQLSDKRSGPAIAAIAQLDEGCFEKGKWIQGRRLNGDDIMIDYDLAARALENKTGTGLKFAVGSEALQRVKLYRYE